MPRLIIEPLADDDIEGARRFYESRRSGLGSEFLDELLGVLERITETLLQFPIVRGQARRARLFTFSHAVTFVIAADAIRVIAVLHSSQNPQIWESRL